MGQPSVETVLKAKLHPQRIVVRNAVRDLILRESGVPMEKRTVPRSRGWTVKDRLRGPAAFTTGKNQLQPEPSRHPSVPPAMARW